MNLPYVVLVHDPIKGEHVHGPFKTAAQASAYGLEHFGTTGQIGAVEWRVRELQAPGLGADR